MLNTIERLRPTLRSSERKVADYVLAQPNRAIRTPLARLAAAAGVSQPTVIRFCRAIGCSGFQAFKLDLAQSLAVGPRYFHSRRGFGPAAPDLSADAAALAARINAARRVDIAAAAAADYAAAALTRTLLLARSIPCALIAAELLSQHAAQLYDDELLLLVAGGDPGAPLPATTLAAAAALLADSPRLAAQCATVMHLRNGDDGNGDPAARPLRHARQQLELLDALRPLLRPRR